MPAAGVYVTNLKEVRRVLTKIQPDLLPVLRKEIKGVIDQTVVPRARGRIPQRSGRAAGSIRSSAGGNWFYVVGGSARVPYFGWLDYGGTLAPTGRRRNTQHRDFIRKGRYLWPAVEASVDQMVAGAGRAVDKVNPTT